MITRQRMTVEEWVRVEDNPIQRDTQRHANKATRKHLKHKCETHQLVSAALLPDGTMYKLDGHTRALLWSTGKLEPPADYVLVDVYNVASKGDVERLYRTFDGSSAAETAADRISGAFRRIGVTPDSGIFTNGGLSSALKLIHGCSSEELAVRINDIVHEWRHELLLIETYHLPHTKFLSGVVAAMLLSVRLHGPDAMEFWRAYTDGKGSNIEGVKDAVAALDECVKVARLSKRTGGAQHMRDITCKAWSCFMRHVRGERLRGAVKATDVTQVIARARVAK